MSHLETMCRTSLLVAITLVVASPTQGRPPVSGRDPAAVGSGALC